MDISFLTGGHTGCISLTDRGSVCACFTASFRGVQGKIKSLSCLALLTLGLSHLVQALLYKVIYRHAGRVTTGPEDIKRKSLQLMPPLGCEPFWTLAAAEWNHMASLLCLLIPHSLESSLGFSQSLLFCDPMTPCHGGGGQRCETDLLWLFFMAESMAVSGSAPCYTFQLPSQTAGPINWMGVSYCLDCIFTSASEIKKLVKTPKMCMYVCLFVSVCISFLIAQRSQVVRAWTESWDLSIGSTLYCLASQAN